MEEKTYIFPLEMDAAKKWQSATYREWCKSLSDDELESINHYVGTGYSRINGCLRSYEEFLDENGKTPEEVDAHISLLDRATQCRIRTAVLLYRGYVFDQLNNAWEAFYPDLEGFAFPDPAFISTSLNEEVAWDFQARYGAAAVFATIVAGEGLLSLSIEEAVGSWEDEILLNKGRKFTIVSATIEQGVRKVVLEVT